jgi:hypothetical protein
MSRTLLPLPGIQTWVLLTPFDLAEIARSMLRPYKFRALSRRLLNRIG